MNNLLNINRKELVYQKEALDILGCDKTKLKQYVDEGKLKRIKNSKDKRFTFYDKQAVEKLAQEDYFYYS